MKKFVCRNCGAVNEASKEALESNRDLLQGTLPQGFEWILPAGKITLNIGDPIYISDMGEHLSHEAYLNKYGIDPEIAYNFVRQNACYRSASRNIVEQSSIKSQISSKRKAQNWLDEDDWTS